VGIELIATPDDIARCLGFAPSCQVTSQGEAVTAAIWRLGPDKTYVMEGPANDSNVISVPTSGHFQCTYFGDERFKWRRPHGAFRMNLVRAGEQPRGLFTSRQRFAILHIYLPQALVQRFAVDSAGVPEGRSIELIDPMCAHDPEIETVCRRMVREMAEPDRCARLMVDALVHVLTIQLIRRHSNVSGSPVLDAKRPPSYRDSRFRLAIDYLEAHLAEDVGVRELADAAGLSITHLTTLFRDSTGEPPHRYLMRRRFERACELLGDPSINIGDIAYRCGFANSQHLASVMRRRVAMTPTAYRRQLLA